MIWITFGDLLRNHINVLLFHSDILQEKVFWLDGFEQTNELKEQS